MSSRLERLFENRENAWVVKGRPDRNDLARMLRPGKTEQWVTRRPPKAWLEGDLIFFWEAAPRLTVCGIGELVGVGPRRNGVTHFQLRADTPVLPRPIGIDALRSDRRLESTSFLKAGAAGTVFPLSRAEATRLASIVLKRIARSPSSHAGCQSAHRPRGSRSRFGSRGPS